MDMSMSMSSTASAAAVAMTSGASSAMSMDGMPMGGGSGPACKISMLWNWYTVDACFISATWQITTPGMFAGSCIGVILLTMSLGFLRRVHRAYDASIAQDTSPLNILRALPSRGQRASKSSGVDSASSGDEQIVNKSPTCQPLTRPARRPSVLQQALRAFLHMAQFAVAYFVMLLAMYYNGYIIICILIGAFLGYFVFEWVPISSGAGADGASATEVTGCCG